MTNLFKQSGRPLRPLACLAAISASLLAFSPISRAAETPTPAAILQELRSFDRLGSVLYIAAHPDDENTLLIGYLARGRDYRTAYLSLTRGDGGQNVLGPEFGEKLGVARTQELLAARRLDGDRQFFSRAMDFGFSKDYRETLRFWDPPQVTADIVRVIREFHPDVVVTRFAPWPTGTHGHHTASAYLALAAFKQAGDPMAFPELHLPPWQPKRILWNGRGNETGTNTVHLEISGNDPVLGISFSDLAGRSRAMHKTQGFGNFGDGGGGRGGGTRTESFQLLAGEPATNDIMDGIDTSWSRVPGGAEIGTLANDIISKFTTNDPAASVPELLNLRSKLAGLAANDPVVVEKRQLLDKILTACLGLAVQTEIPQAEVVAGETLALHHTVSISSAVPVRWVAVRFPDIVQEAKQSILLTTNEASTRDVNETLPANTPLSQPYWLREESTPGMFRVTDASLIGRPENPPVFPVEYVFEVGGQTLAVPDEPVEVIPDASTSRAHRRMDVIPPVTLHFDSEVALFAPGSSHVVNVQITATRPGTAGTLQLETPRGWSVTPAKQPFQFVAAHEQASFQFTVTAPAKSTTGAITASAEIGGKRYRNDRELIDYPHIPLQLLQPPASIKVVGLDLVTRGQNIGYLPGAGDSLADNLKQMGYHVTELDDTNLTAAKLQGLDAVVIGVRAFNVRNNLAKQLPVLFSYVENGGTVVAQYNRPDGLRAAKIAPYDLHLSGLRITDETAAITFLAPDHPVLNTPNKITAADFDGWIQERGIYFPDKWDAHFTPILAGNDPGETSLQGSLLVAPYGKGHFVYTGLVFFRELPAGVPGAYRLFANLVSLGQ